MIPKHRSLSPKCKKKRTRLTTEDLIEHSFSFLSTPALSHVSNELIGSKIINAHTKRHTIPFFILDSPLWKALWQDARPGPLSGTALSGTALSDTQAALSDTALSGFASQATNQMITRQKMSEQGVKDVYRDVKTRMLELFKTLLGLKTLGGVCSAALIAVDN